MKLNELLYISNTHDTIHTPSNLEREIFAEISTPMNLRKDMLDIIPIQFWKDKNKRVWEPSCGKGGFVIDIVIRFMVGLENEIETEEERYKYIVENCIYFNDISKTNVEICKSLLGGTEYSLNYTIEDCLLHKPTITYDLIIGNPPYDKFLYKKFMRRHFEYCEKILYVIPSTWAVNVSCKQFIEQIKSFGIHTIQFLPNGIFPTVNIETMIIYLDNQLKNNTNYTLNSIITDIKYPITNHTNDKEYNIFRKCYDLPKLTLFKETNKTLNYKNPIETDNIKMQRNDIHCNKMISRLNGCKNIEEYWVRDYTQKYNTDKLVFPRGTASYNSISKIRKLKEPIVKSKFITKHEIISNTLVFIPVSCIEEAKFLDFYILYSKFCRFLFLRQNKFGELTKGFINCIPYLDYKKCDCSDESIYQSLGLNTEEINTIENLFIENDTL